MIVRPAPTMRGSGASRALAAAAALLPLAGCRGTLIQSALEPHGPQAAKIAHLFWFAFITASIAWALTVIAMLWAGWRARRRETSTETLPANHEGSMARSVTLAVGATVGVLLVFLVVDFSVGRTLSPPPSRTPLTIEITGHQWWWEVHYADTSVHDRAVTANEVHVPVGRDVLLLLTADDVIHSIWVPSLAGKKDLIPGYTQSIWFRADTAGIYRGQCAEFCGTQHAKMALYVVAEPADRFDAWLSAQRTSAAPPSDTTAKHGQQVFLSGSCAMCHAVAGTSAGSNAGPDLTHLASRRTIAAGTLPNTRGNLAGWIVDPQRVKPGAHMPPNMLPSKDLEALLTYLQGLK